MNCLDESNPDTKPDNLDRLMPRPAQDGLTLCYLTFEDALAMRTTGDVEGDAGLSPPPPSTLPELPTGYTWEDPDPRYPSFRAPNGVITCCGSVAQAVNLARLRAAGR